MYWVAPAFPDSAAVIDTSATAITGLKDHRLLPFFTSFSVLLGSLKLIHPSVKSVVRGPFLYLGGGCRTKERSGSSGLESPPTPARGGWRESFYRRDGRGVGLGRDGRLGGLGRLGGR